VLFPLNPPPCSDATYGGDEEEADTTTIGDVTVCTKAPQAPAALSEPVEVKVAIKQEEVKDEEQSPAPVGFNKPKFSAGESDACAHWSCHVSRLRSSWPVGSVLVLELVGNASNLLLQQLLTYCTVLCCMPTAESLIHKYETLKKKLQALTFTFKQAPTSAPSWCVLGDIATPELLDLLDTTQPASALRHLKASCNLKPLTVKISPITGESDARTHAAAALLVVQHSLVASSIRLRGCRMFALCQRPLLPQHLTRRALCVLRPAGWAAGKTTTPVPAWCVLGDVATPELLAVITATKPTSPLRACALRLKAHCARKQPKSNPTAAYSGPKASGRIPTWCVIGDVADPDLMALIFATKKTPGATAAAVVSALHGCVLRVKARWADVRS
jgi:hypothetical protein